MTRRTRRESIAAIEAKRPTEPTIVVGPGPAPMTTRLAEILIGMVDRQRARERGSPS